MNTLNTLNTEEITTMVNRAVCESLALEEDEVTPQSRLINDLGMDSLDFLDIMFQLEKSFNTPIRDRDFDRLLRPDQSELAAAGEFLSEQEVKELSAMMPDLVRAAQQEKIPRKDLFVYVTVETLVKMVTAKLQAPPQDAG